MLNNALVHFLPVNDHCSLCKAFKETYVHLFWECPKSQQIWKYVHSLVGIRFATKQLSMFPVKVPNKVLFLFMLCKHFLFICRCFNRHPYLYRFKVQLNFHLKTLKFVYTKRSKEDYFEKEWGDIFTVLNV